jgi:hypothetical protein
MTPEPGEERVMGTTSQSGVRELDRRSNDGIHVMLLWSPHTNRVFVAVVDERDGEAFELEVDPANALDAFRHPFAYADRDYEELALAS